MSGLRPCPSCGRHARTDEARCPFCGAALPFTHRLPVLPPLREERSAPKYGGPPLRRPTTWLGCLVLVIGAALALWLWRG